MRTNKNIYKRAYFQNYELYHELDNADDLVLERFTHHINDGEKKVATLDQETGSNTMYRYQYGNNLGSVGLELDDSAGIISYEEYYPFGGTAYYAHNSAIDVPRKRYKYCGKEQDEEPSIASSRTPLKKQTKGEQTGLYYYGARYYAPWLYRFTSVDPKALEYVHQSTYVFADNNPIVKYDVNGEGTNGDGCAGENQPQLVSPTVSSLVGNAKEVELIKPAISYWDNWSLPDSSFHIANNQETIDDIKSLVKQENLIYLNFKGEGDVLKVSTNFNSLATTEISNVINKDEGLKLIYELSIAARKTLYEVSNIALLRNEAGERVAATTFPNSIHNASNFGKDSGNGHDTRPISEFDGQVVITPHTGWVEGKTPQGDDIMKSRRSVVFHELAENYVRTELNMDYNESFNSIGAHNYAVEREKLFWGRSIHPGSHSGKDFHSFDRSTLGNFEPIFKMIEKQYKSNGYGLVN